MDGRLKVKLARLASASVPAPAAACSLVDDGTMFIYGSNGPFALASRGGVGLVPSLKMFVFGGSNTIVYGDIRARV